MFDTLLTHPLWELIPLPHLVCFERYHGKERCPFWGRGLHLCGTFHLLMSIRASLGNQALSSDFHSNVLTANGQLIDAMTDMDRRPISIFVLPHKSSSIMLKPEESKQKRVMWPWSHHRLLADPHKIPPCMKRTFFFCTVFMCSIAQRWRWLALELSSIICEVWFFNTLQVFAWSHYLIDVYFKRITKCWHFCCGKKWHQSETAVCACAKLELTDCCSLTIPKRLNDF